MKNLRYSVFLWLCLFVPRLIAQTAGPANLSTPGDCLSLNGVDSQKATAGIVVTGTFSGTLQAKGSINGQTPFNVQVTPYNSSTPQATITAVGGYSAPVAGLNNFQVCVTSMASGTAVVSLNPSNGASAKSGSSGGSGDATSVNGGSVPASAALAATNSSGQIIAATTPVPASLGGTGKSAASTFSSVALQYGGLLCKVNTDQANTGSTTENIVNTCTMPGGTMLANSVINTKILGTAGASNSGTCSFRMRMSASPTVVGGFTVGSTVAISANRPSLGLGFVAARNSTSAEINAFLSTTATNQTNQGSQTASLDLTATTYLLTTVQNSVSGDSCTLNYADAVLYQ